MIVSKRQDLLLTATHHGKTTQIGDGRTNIQTDGQTDGKIVSESIISTSSPVKIPMIPYRCV